MRSTLRSLDEPTEKHEPKSDLPQTSIDVPPGEAVGRLQEDHDLSQFGYKAELEVSIPISFSMELQLIGYSDVLACGP